MTIMALVLVGILQMFSVSLLINKGAAARTQMLFKCQQVVENLRWYYYVTSNNMAAPTNTGIPALGAATVNLPYDGSETEYAFWGPAGANVIERPNGPYKVSYTLAEDVAQEMGTTLPLTPIHVWVITVSAVPTDVAGAARYLGVGLGSPNSKVKRVDYVAQFTQ